MITHGEMNVRSNVVARRAQIRRHTPKSVNTKSTLQSRELAVPASQCRSKLEDESENIIQEVDEKAAPPCHRQREAAVDD